MCQQRFARLDVTKGDAMPRIGDWYYDADGNYRQFTGDTSDTTPEGQPSDDLESKSSVSNCCLIAAIVIAVVFLGAIVTFAQFMNCLSNWSCWASGVGR